MIQTKNVRTSATNNHSVTLPFIFGGHPEVELANEWCVLANVTMKAKANDTSRDLLNPTSITRVALCKCKSIK